MNFDSCWKRIKDELSIKNYTQLSEIIGTSTSNITKKKQQGVFPVEWAYTIGKKYGVLTEWIMTGDGPKSLDKDKNENFENNQEENFEDPENYVECHRNRKFIKKVPIIKGALYVIEPMNPTKQKMRGEKVIVIETPVMGPLVCLRIDSEWHLKRRDYTEIDPCDLKLISIKPSLEELGLHDNKNKK